MLTLASIAQNGTNLTLIGSTTATATVTSTTQLQVGGVTATYGDSQITFGATGTFANQVWTKLDLPTDYTNPAGCAGAHHSERQRPDILRSKRHAVARHVDQPHDNLGLRRNGDDRQLAGSPASCSGRTALSGARSSILPEPNNGSGTTNIQAVPSKVLVTDYLTGQRDHGAHRADRHDEYRVRRPHRQHGAGHLFAL